MNTRLSFMLAIAAIVAVWGLTSLCFAQTFTAETGNPKIVYLKSIKIQAGALDAKLDQDTDTPKYVIYEDIVVFFDKNGKEKNIKKGLVRASENGKYIGILDCVPEDEYTANIYFTLYDENGYEIIPRRKWLKTDMESDYLVDISNNGKFVFYDTYYGVLYFPHNNKKLKKVELYPEGTIRFWTDISNDGKYYAVNAAPGEHSESAMSCPVARVILYDIYGNAIWERKLENNTPSKVKISTKNNYIYSLDYESLGIRRFYIHSLVNGNILLKYDNNFKVGSYSITKSKDDDNFVLIYSGSKIDYFDIVKRKLIFNYEDPNTSISFTSSAITRDGKYILLGATTCSHQSDTLPRYVYLLSNDGKQLWRKQLNGSGYKNYLSGPNVKILDSPSKFQIITPNEILIYKISYTRGD